MVCETASVTLALWGSFALGHALCLAGPGPPLAGRGPWPCQSPIVISKLGRTGSASVVEMALGWGGLPLSLGGVGDGRAPLTAQTRLAVGGGSGQVSWHLVLVRQLCEPRGLGAGWWGHPCPPQGQMLR